MRTIDTRELAKWSENYTGQAHLAGQGENLANWTNDKFIEYGLSSEIVPYYTYLNYPINSSLSLLDSDDRVLFRASLEEDVLDQDPTTGNDDRVPVFHGYAANGTAKGQFVFANYGRKEDYDRLVGLGIDFKDKIVICRYGKIFRGLKVKFAQDLGAVGVVIYSDPTDDVGIDFQHGELPYPHGPARNPSSVQRGSVGFLSYGPGDPTTPGWASHEDAERKDPYDLIPTIPSIPISYADAIPILKELNGKGPKNLAPDWNGILVGVEYNIGPSESVLSLVNEQDFDIRPIHNVIATFEGQESGQAVVVGNHRDSWIAGGAGDPNSGSAVLLALAKALGKLKEKGWRPYRTIILASWDGEEYALLGSTEWGEDHAQFIDKKVVSYINLDNAVSGSYFKAGASPSLNELIRKVTKQVKYPKTDKTVFDTWSENNGNRISTLGTGSDYTVFLDHLGVPSLDFSFKPGKGDPVYHYHSNYDSFHWMTRVDPDFELHATAAKILVALTLGLADNRILDFRFEEYSSILKSGLDSILEKHDVSSLVDAYETEFEIMHDHRHNDRDDRRNHDRDHNRDHNRDRDNRQNRRDRHECEARTPKEHVDCLKKTLDRFQEAGKLADTAHQRLEELYDKRDSLGFWGRIKLHFRVRLFNGKSRNLERLFISGHGLENRTWYKHVLLAPNRYLGYGGTVFPRVLETLEDKDGPKFVKAVAQCRAVLEAAAGLLFSI